MISSLSLQPTRLVEIVAFDETSLRAHIKDAPKEDAGDDPEDPNDQDTGEAVDTNKNENVYDTKEEEEKILEAPAEDNNM